MAVDALEDTAFGLGLFDESFMYRQCRLFELFLRKKSSGCLLLHEKYCAKCSLPKASQWFEILSRHLASNGILHQTSFDSSIKWFLNRTLADEVVFDRNIVGCN